MYKSGLFKKLFVILDEHYQFCMSKKKHLMIGCSVSNQLNTKFEYLLSVIIANCGYLFSTFHGCSSWVGENKLGLWRRRCSARNYCGKVAQRDRSPLGTSLGTHASRAPEYRSYRFITSFSLVTLLW